MIRVEERQIAVVQDLVDMTQQTYVFDEVVLLLRFLSISGPGVQVSQFSYIDRHGHDGNCAFVKGDCFRVPSLACAHFAQTCERAVVTGMDGERSEIGAVSGSSIAVQ